MSEPSDATATALIDDTFSKLVAYQKEHVKTSERYLQLLPLTDKVPEDGKQEDVKADQAASATLLTWADAVADLPATSEVSMSVTEYLAPGGPGWELVSQQITDGVLQEMVKGEGSEADERNHDWVEIPGDA